MKIKPFIFLIIIPFYMGCEANKPTAESTENTKPMQFDKRLEGKWVLEYMTPVNGKDVKQLYKIQKPFLNFVDDTKVAGNNGCNNIAGEYSLSGDIIRFETEKFISTRMFCEGVDEKAFTGILKTVNRYDVIEDGNKLLLLTSDIISMQFVKADSI